SAEKIAAAVGSTDLSWPTADQPLLDMLPRGRTVAAQGVLFAKIEDARVAEWSERFGGAEA
ncbi:MAG: methionine--tRNA ligase, partial [Alphaproteobacteria bacterium]